jgi:serine/threonine protein kinase
VQELYHEGDFSSYLKERGGEERELNLLISLPISSAISMKLKLGRKIFSQNEILRFLANIIIIVFDINSRNIYHRDLNPANFLIKRD